MSTMFQAAEDHLFAHYALPLARRRLRLADPPLEVGVLETGAGAPVLFVHGSGMCAATWAPMLAELPDRRAIAVDLPGFGASDPYDYSGRSLREHAVAQITSILDALGLDRAPIAGTSLGAMFALCAAADAPDRVDAVIAFGMPAVSLPGLRRDPVFAMLTTPGVGRLVLRAPAPRSAAATRKASRRALGRPAAEAMPDELFDVIRAPMAGPGWREAMRTHLNLAMRRGKARPENALSRDDLRSITAPVRFVWGDADVYGGPDLAREALELIPDAQIHVVPGGHAPFLDAPALSAEVVRSVA